MKRLVVLAVFAATAWLGVSAFVSTAQTNSPNVPQAIKNLQALKARLNTDESRVDAIIAELGGTATSSPTVAPTGTAQAPTPTATASATAPPPTPSPTVSPTPAPTATATGTPAPSQVLTYPFTYTLAASTPMSALPSDSACAQTIVAHRATGGDPDAGPVERDTENQFDNQRDPLTGYTLQDGTVVPPYHVNNNTYFTVILSPQRWGGIPSPDIEQRITGDFTSASTDEIIQWAACKWGFDVNDVRAQIVVESDFFQGLLGDCDSPGQVYALLDPCRSFGLLGLSGGFLPTATDAAYIGSFPYALDSTAFDLDYSLALRRACYAGRETYYNQSVWQSGGTYAAGDLWGCIGAWFAGAWKTAAANGYANTVKQAFAAKSWLSESPAATCETRNQYQRCIYR